MTLSALTFVAVLSASSAFWSKDLAGLRRAIDTMIIENAPKQAGPAHFWTEVEALVTCTPLTADERRAFVPRTEWERLIALVRLERLRLARTGLSASPFAEALSNESSFTRTLTRTPTNLIEWPTEDEAWSDEFTSPVPRESQCDQAGPAEDVPAAREAELAAVEGILSSMAHDHPAFASLVVHAVSLLLRAGETEQAWVAGRVLTSLPLESIAPSELASVRLVRALVAEASGQSDGLVEEWRALSALELGSSHTLVTSRLESALVREQRWEELLVALDAHSIRHDAMGWYRAYQRARALDQLKRPAQLLAHARDVLTAVPESALQTPSLEALQDLVWAYLSSTSFNDRVVEVVESLGSPRLLYSRVDRLATVALRAGRTVVARDAWAWLLAHHQNAQAHARYRAGLADVAFLSGERKAFRAILQELTRPDTRLLDAIPPSRRGAFFDERDKALLSLARRVVPRLGERRDDAWTATFVEVLQTFLRNAPESRSHAALTELYRTARGLLSPGAKSYSERIGDERPTLVLGEVRIERVLPEPPAPEVLVVIDEPRFLLRIPITDQPSPVRAWFEAKP